MTADEKLEQARQLRAQADQLAEEAREDRRKEIASRPLLERLCFAATARCPCGAGLAYDPASDGSGTPFRGPSAWECSAILLGTALRKDQPGSVSHTAPLPFAFYEVKSEDQLSAQGRKTRPVP